MSIRAIAGNNLRQVDHFDSVARMLDP